MIYVNNQNKEQYNLYNLKPQFKKYLLAVKKLKLVSAKNYLSDLEHFLGWLTFYISSKKGQNAIPKVSDITKDSIFCYKNYLLKNNISHKTINRRLSTIRLLCRFCLQQQLINHNPSKYISNINQNFIFSKTTINQFKNYLEKDTNKSPFEKKEILNDCEEFLKIVFFK